MHTRNKFWWFVALALCITAATLVVLGVFFWQDLTPAERKQLLDLVIGHPTFFFMAAILFIAAVGFALDGALNSYILPLNRMVEGANIILSANPSHRLEVNGGSTIQHLAHLMNLLAARIESSGDEITARVAAAKDDSDREKSILAAMVAELPSGVVVCNLNHRIILYNRKARGLLEAEAERVPQEDGSRPAAPGRYLGLGRSITSLVDGELIRFAMEDVIRKVAQNDASTATHFVIAGAGDRLIQAEMVPVLDNRREFTGYILILSDVTERMVSRQRMSTILGNLITRARASLAGIRAAIETMVTYTDIEASRRQRLRAIIHDEAVTLSGILDESAAQLPSATRSRWPLMPVRLNDLLRALTRRCQNTTSPCSMHLTLLDDDLWIKADSYLLLNALAAIVDRVGASADAARVDISGRVEGRFVHVDLLWRETAVSESRLHNWMCASLETTIPQVPMSLAQIVERHDGELIVRKPTEDPSRQIGLRLLLPTLIPPRRGLEHGPAVISASRPEFYDFDLFSQPGQLPHIDSQSLETLSFTVFDTETTGLNPRGGDEIISLGALRVVNLRLLTEEKFDQLINPQREIPWESIKYHGIRQEMVADKPTVDQVLAQFHRFVADTVLVAHNAAFDMRMFQMKEVASGIYFINPVLDTMLLSAVVHPTYDDHSLEGIAHRLGVTVEARHTAIGDALTTAKLFLKLVPLLRQQGIVTLGDARRASQKTYFARLEY